MSKLFNTYIEGMDRDTSFSHYGNKRYFSARNMRPMEDDGLSFSEMKTILGNASTGIDFGAGQQIIGYGEFRNYGMVFTTDCSTENPGGVNPDVAENSASTGTIWKIDYTVSPITKTAIYTLIPNVTTKHPINYEVYCYYDNEDRQKVYWVDHFNLLRHINTANIPSSADKLDIVADVEMSQAYLKTIGTGNLDVGVVQYAYQLYDLGGGETTFSPASPLYTISKSNEFATNTKKYSGSAKLDSNGNLTNSGKSFNIQIDDIDTAFDKIKIVSIHYSTVDSTPTINVVSILDVTSSINVWDSGSYQLGTISLEEFRTLGGNLIIPKTLSVKDNILFAGNIKQKYFDVDFDARAYRFRTTGGTESSIWNDGTGFDLITKAGSWPNATFKIGTSNIPKTHNCVNPYNYNPVGGDGSPSAPYNTTDWARFIFQSDGTTIGGEGPNVKYEIRRIHSFTTKYASYDGEFSVDKAATTDHYTINNRPNPTASYGDHCNSYMKRLLGYKRNEIYRFGIVCFNGKGQQSFVKWIADIKMPTNSQFQFADGVISSATFTLFYDLCIDFYVENLPDDVVGYQIVRVKREEKDRTIVASGILSHTLLSEYDGDNYSPLMVRYKSPVPLGYYSSQGTLLFISPEVNYYKNLNYNVGDILFLEGTTEYKTWRMTRGDTYGPGSTTTQGLAGNINIVKFTQTDVQVTYKGIGNFGANNGYYYPVADGRMFEPSNEDNYEVNKVDINGQDYTNYAAGNGHLSGVNAAQRGPAGTKYVIGLDTSMNQSLLGSDTHDVYYADYIRNNANIIYGGLNYENRQLNEYIPAGEYVDVSTLLDPADYGDYGSYFDPRITVFGGDIYINVFEHLMVPQDAEDYNGDGDPDLSRNWRITSWVRFPCESSVNLALTHGASWWRGDNAKSLVMREVAGDYLREDYSENETTFTQDEDMYLYNSVYSQSNTSKTFYPEPADWAAIKDYDTLVYNSDTKMKGSDLDAWLRFRVNNEIDLDSSYGPLQKLLLFKQNMIFFQDNAFGTLSIRQRQLLQTEGGGSLELGSGGILDRFDLLSTKDGCQHPTSILATSNAFYWYDAKRKRFNRYIGEIDNLSDKKNMYSFFKNISDDFMSYTNIIEGDGIVIAHDEKFHEVLLTFKDSTDSSSNETVVFNELSNRFTGFYDLQAMFYMQGYGKLYSSLSLQTVYEENVGDPANWFGTHYDSVLELIVNPNNGVVNVFNNFEYYSRVFIKDDSDEQNDNTWDKIQMLNSYQDSGIETIVVGTNIKRRMRIWRFKDFRDNTNGARFRDQYVKLIFTFSNANRIYMHDLATYFLVPAESLAR